MSEIVDTGDVQYTKAGTVRKRKPKQSILYFTQETEDAILEYLGSSDEAYRSKLYKEKIDYPFYKLAENIIHTFKFYYTEATTVEELKYEVIAVLLEKLHRYDQSKGKAYSYFGTIVKRYLINYNKKNYKKRKEKAPLEDVDLDKSVFNSVVRISEKIQSFEKVNIIDVFVEYTEQNLTLLFPKPKEAKVADAVLELFKKRKGLEVLSKKALYIYIREMTDAPTPVVTVVVKKLKMIYRAVLNQYIAQGYDVDIY